MEAELCVNVEILWSWKGSRSGVGILCLWERDADFGRRSWILEVPDRMIGAITWQELQLGWIMDLDDVEVERIRYSDGRNERFGLVGRPPTHALSR